MVAMLGDIMQLSRYIEKNGLSYAQFANMIDGDPKTVSRYAQGIRVPKPRIMAMAANLGLIPGLALALGTVDPDDGMPWDFSIGAKRIKAK